MTAAQMLQQQSGNCSWFNTFTAGIGYLSGSMQLVYLALELLG